MIILVVCLTLNSILVSGNLFKACVFYLLFCIMQALVFSIYCAHIFLSAYYCTVLFWTFNIISIIRYLLSLLFSSSLAASLFLCRTPRKNYN